VLAQLTLVQARRFATHPLFLVGAVLAAVGLVQGLLAGPDLWRPQNLVLATALWLGLPSVVVGYRLTITEEAASPLLPSTPVPATSRTLALCGACLVPALAGALLLVGTIAATVAWQPSADLLPAGIEGATTGGSLNLPAYLTAVGWADAIAHWTEGFVAAPFGGAALGVAAARWWRLPGGGVIVAVGLGLLVLVVNAAAENVPGVGHTWPARLAVTVSPFVLWETQAGDIVTGVRAGSPLGHLSYAMCLSGLAVWAALAKDTSSPHRVLGRRVGLALAIAAALTATWALLG